MGWSGAGLFDNDDASDFLASIQPNTALDQIERCIMEGCADATGTEIGSTMAAVAVLCSLLDPSFAERHPPLKDILAAGLVGRPSDDVLRTALLAVELAQKNTDFAEQWFDPKEYRRWRKAGKELCKLLETELGNNALTSKQRRDFWASMVGRQTETRIRQSIGKRENQLLLNEKGITEVPAILGECTELEILGLGFNKLKSIPPSVENLTKLKRLFLGANPIRTVPDFVWRLPSLEVLDLSHTKITSVAPPAKLESKLRELDLSFNKRIELAPSFGGLDSLEELDLTACQLHEFPQSILALENLRTLKIGGFQWGLDSRNYDNKLTDLPLDMAMMKNLQRLDLSHNRFPRIPAAIKLLRGLTRLSLDRCELGEVGVEDIPWDSLEQLSLASNPLTSFPEVPSTATQLKVLDLSSCRLEEIPDSVRHLTGLTALFLTQNPIQRIPPWLGTLPHLEQLHISPQHLVHPSEEEFYRVVRLGIEELKRHIREVWN